MIRRRIGPMRLTVDVPTRWTAEVRGHPRHIIRTLDRAGVPRHYDYRPPSGGAACWTFPAGRVGDVLAAVDSLNGRAQLNDAVPSATTEPGDLEPQGGLW